MRLCGATPVVQIERSGQYRRGRTRIDHKDRMDEFSIYRDEKVSKDLKLATPAAP
jgi:hypothetical protein